MSTPDVGAAALFPDLHDEVAETSRIEGMLPSQEIRKLIAKGHIRAFAEISEREIKPGSLDRRLGDVGYRVQASFVPLKSTVEHGIADAGLVMSLVDITRTTVFEKGCVYIVPLLEHLDLPDWIAARANPKSSTGRLDIFIRLITDYGEEFEQVKRGYQGKLYVEIAPRTFSVIVRAGTTLNQLRFLSGNPKPSDPATAALEKAPWQREEALVYGEEGIPAKARIAKKHVTLSVNLRGADSREVVAYKAKKNTPVIDLANIDFYDPEDFWDVKHDLGNRGLILEAGDRFNHSS